RRTAAVPARDGLEGHRGRAAARAVAQRPHRRRRGRGRDRRAVRAVPGRAAGAGVTSVWAPYATRVDLDLGGGVREPMLPGSGGWWHGPDPLPGSDYGFVLDGDGTVLP